MGVGREDVSTEMQPPLSSTSRLPMVSAARDSGSYHAPCGMDTTPGMMREVTLAVSWVRPRSVDTMTASSCLTPRLSASCSLIQHCCGATDFIQSTLP